MKTCDICNKKLRFKRFRYQAGYICEECYRRASKYFTETVANISLDEIRQRIESCQKRSTQDTFEISAKIGNYLLIDEKNKKICIINNRMNKREDEAPMIYSISEIETCRIETEPNLSIKDIDKKIDENSGEIIKKLKLELQFNHHKNVEITLIDSNVRIKSFAFKKSLSFAKRMDQAIKGMIEIERI